MRAGGGCVVIEFSFLRRHFFSPFLPSAGNESVGVRPTVRTQCDAAAYIGARPSEDLIATTTSADADASSLRPAPELQRFGNTKLGAPSAAVAVGNDSHNVESLNVSNALCVALFHLLGR